MIAHLRSVILAVLFAIPLIAVACDKVPLLAPTGTVITLIPESPTASLNSTVNIIATVIENGTAAGTGQSTKGAGTPVQNGTVVNFTTTLGSIEPAEARTHNGQVTVRLVTSNQSGMATITAYSGGTSAQKDIKVGSAAAAHVTVSATPQNLGSSGGASQVAAVVTDDTGRTIAGVPVTFTTDNGTLSQSVVTTDGSGRATTTLTTGTTATVSAQAGSLAVVTTKVSVGARALSSFSVTPTSTSAGSPVNFTVTPTTGVNVQNVHVDFGDGDSRDLGAISSAQSFPKAYNAPGTYNATATAIDATGGQSSLTTSVIVGSLPVTVSASSTSPSVNAAVTFTATTGTATPAVRSYRWSTDDGQSQTTTGPTWITSFPRVGQRIVSVSVIGLDGSVLGTGSVAVNVQP